MWFHIEEGLVWRRRMGVNAYDSRLQWLDVPAWAMVYAVLQAREVGASLQDPPKNQDCLVLASNRAVPRWKP